jgi:hypothetical protein
MNYIGVIARNCELYPCAGREDEGIASCGTRQFCVPGRGREAIPFFYFPEAGPEPCFGGTARLRGYMAAERLAGGVYERTSVPLGNTPERLRGTPKVCGVHQSGTGA